MLRRSTLALPLCLLALAACGDDQQEFVPLPVVRGAPIDGSGDIGADALVAEVEDTGLPTAVVQETDPQGATDAAAEVSNGAAGPGADEVAVDDAEQVVPESAEGAALADPETGEANAAEAVADAGNDEESATEATAEVEHKPLEPDEEGVYHLAFSDLSLEGEDVDNIIDYLLFPDEFEEGEGFEFPEHLKALDGKEITISGYMIPGRIRKNMVKDFMLVRDLAGCCFGGAPNPDEWIDVVMVGDAQAEYLRYLPIKVKGTLTLIGEQDQEGYAVGVYRMKATWAGEED
jgi:hypothetical protein